SDAGMPLVSDPGYVLVRACVAAGLPVEVLPGPSAALAALVASALPSDRWRFAGFLPRKKGELRRALSEPGGTLVAFEAPGRVPATLAVLAEVDPDRQVAVCRELTKVHEEVVRGSAGRGGARCPGPAGGGGREAAGGRRRGGRADRRFGERSLQGVRRLVPAMPKARLLSAALALAVAAPASAADWSAPRAISNVSTFASRPCMAFNASGRGLAGWEQQFGLGNAGRNRLFLANRNTAGRYGRPLQLGPDELFLGGLSLDRRGRSTVLA